MIALGSDHAGLPLKKEIMALLDEMQLPYHDYGTYTADSCDYAVFAQRAAKAVVGGECERGILCCGTGIGMAVAANKVQGIRAAMARLADEEADVPLPGATPEEVPLGRRTCAVCAADNDGSRETCWNCGASLRRVR